MYSWSTQTSHRNQFESSFFPVALSPTDLWWVVSSKTWVYAKPGPGDKPSRHGSPRHRTLRVGRCSTPRSRTATRTRGPSPLPLSACGEAVTVTTYNHRFMWEAALRWEQAGYHLLVANIRNRCASVQPRWAGG